MKWPLFFLALPLLTALARRWFALSRGEAGVFFVSLVVLFVLHDVRGRIAIRKGGA